MHCFVETLVLGHYKFLNTFVKHAIITSFDIQPKFGGGARLYDHVIR